jgi:hypothetical protein
MPTRAALACALILPACRGVGPAHPPAPAAADTTPPPPVKTLTRPAAVAPSPPDMCADPAAAFADYRWLPNEVFTLVAARPGDSALATSLETLETRLLGADDRLLAFVTRLADGLPRVRALLERASLPADELVLLAAGDLHVWAAPRLCGADSFTRVAAALGLRVHEAQAPRPVTIAAPHATHGLALVQLAAGGPLWIVPADAAEALHTWLASLSGAPGEFYAGWLRDHQHAGPLRLVDTDPVPPGAADTMICLTTRRLVVSGTGVDSSYVHTLVQIRQREPARRSSVRALAPHHRPVLLPRPP